MGSPLQDPGLAILLDPAAGHEVAALEAVGEEGYVLHGESHAAPHVDAAEAEDVVFTDGSEVIAATAQEGLGLVGVLVWDACFS